MMRYLLTTWWLRIVTTGGLFIAWCSGSTVAENEIHWQDIGQICGRVSSTVSTKKTIRTVDGKVEVREYETPIRLVHLTVYKAENQTSTCCSQRGLLGETVSGRHGEFRFSGYAAGYYWLVVHLRDGDVNIPVRTGKYDKSGCEDKSVHRIIFVDATPFPKVEVRIL